MSIKILPRAGIQVSGATAVEISHENDSISLGDGLRLLEFLEASPGVWALPVQPIGGGDASAANQTNGNQRTKITDGTDNAEIDDVGGEKALKVSVIASVGGGGGGTAATDSAAYTAGASQFTPIGGAFDDASSDALAEGEMGMARLTSGRALHVAVQNSVAVTGTFWQTTQPVSGTFWQTTQPISAAALPLPSGAATEAGLTTIAGHVDGIEALLTTQNGYLDGLEGFVDGLEGYLDGVEGLLTDIESATDGIEALLGGTLTVGTHAVTQSGTWNIGSITTLPTVTVNTHAVTQSGTWNIGSITTLPSISLAASSNNIGDVDIASIAANQVITPFALRGTTVRGAVTLSNTTSTSIIAAAGASTYTDITNIIATNTSSTAVRVDFRDNGTGGTVIFSVWLAANGGAVIPFPVPLPQGSANAAWAVQLSASVTDVRILMVGVQRT